MSNGEIYFPLPHDASCAQPGDQSSYKGNGASTTHCIRAITYIFTNFAGGFLLTFVYLQFGETMGPGVTTALVASTLVWIITRIYDGGHVAMGQMPLKLFAIMSIGLGAGYIAESQVLREFC